MEPVLLVYVSTVAALALIAAFVVIHSEDEEAA